MNLRQPYEQLIADKLRHLPAQDANNSWQQMKRLLDDDEDIRGGGRKRPPGNSGWWRVGMLAIVLSAGFWIYEKTATPDTRLSTTTNATAPAAANDNTPAATDKSNNHQTPAIDNTTTLKSAADNSSANEKTATAIGAETVKESIIPNNPALKPGAVPGTGNTPAVALNENAHKKAIIPLTALPAIVHCPSTSAPMPITWLMLAILRLKTKPVQALLPTMMATRLCQQTILRSNLTNLPSVHR